MNTKLSPAPPGLILASLLVWGWQTEFMLYAIIIGLLLELPMFIKWRINFSDKDTNQLADKLLHKVINYRIFEDDDGKMNKSLLDIQGELLIVSQFTLPADTRKGMRPSFTPAAPPAMGLALYEYFIEQAELAIEPSVQTGEFGADMQVSLVNDGPVTFWLEV